VRLLRLPNSDEEEEEPLSGVERAEEEEEAEEKEVGEEEEGEGWEGKRGEAARNCDRLAFTRTRFGWWDGGWLFISTSVDRRRSSLLPPFNWFESSVRGCAEAQGSRVCRLIGRGGEGERKPVEPMTMQRSLPLEN
jgi:hypothetical protein